MTDPTTLDRLAARAFRGSEEEHAGGWLLRAATDDPHTARVNSALPIGFGLDVAVVERWYDERGLPPRIMLSPSEQLEALDADLAARGWTRERPADVLAGTPAGVLQGLAGPPHDVVPTEMTTPPTPPGALRSLDPVVQLGAAGGAGRGTVVLQDGWSLMLALEVAPERRREGIGAALVRAWARLASGRGLYLQVRTGNAPGHRLYERAGFVRSHGYHYRTRVR